MNNTFDSLMEQCQALGIRRTALVRQYLEWREDSVIAQSEPLDVYIEKMRFFRENIERAFRRENGWTVDIDELDCYFQGHEQGWRCALTGEPLEFTRGGHDFNGQWSNPRSCTNDRIDPNQGYNIDNLQLVTWEANLFKQGFTMGQFKNLIVKCHRQLVGKECQNASKIFESMLQ